MYQPGPIPNNQGLIRQFAVTAPGAGAAVDITISTNVRWRLKAIEATFTADANVANRFVQVTWGLTLGDFRVYANLTQTAGQAIAYQFHEGGPDRSTAINSFLNVQLPHKILLNDAFLLRLTADNIQVGDAFTSINVIVEEWIEE